MPSAATLGTEETSGGTAGPCDGESREALLAPIGCLLYTRSSLLGTLAL